MLKYALMSMTGHEYNPYSEYSDAIKKSDRRFWGGVASIAGVGALSLAVIFPNLDLGEPEYVQEGNRYSTNCHKVSPHSLAVAESLMSMPQNPLIEKVKQQNQDERSQMSPLTAITDTKIGAGDLRTIEYETRKAVADKEGLTILDPRPTIESNFKTPQTNQQRIATTGAFLRQYGLDLKITQDAAQRPTDREIEQPATRTALHMLVQTFAKYPVEFVKQSDTATIELTNTGGGASYGDGKRSSSGKPNGVLSFNIYSTSQDTVAHELYHSWERNICGSGDAALYDTNFGRVNNATERPNAPNIEDYVEKANDAIIARVTARSQDDLTKACTIESELPAMAKNTRSTDGYDRIGNHPELKANLSRAFIDPTHLRRYTSPKMPIIRDSFKYVLGRLVQTKKGTNIARYFTQTLERDFDNLRQKKGC